MLVAYDLQNVPHKANLFEGEIKTFQLVKQNASLTHVK